MASKVGNIVIFRSMFFFSSFERIHWKISDLKISTDQCGFGNRGHLAGNDYIVSFRFIDIV